MVDLGEGEKTMKIYFVHPITGLDYETVMKYYNDMRAVLSQYEHLCPMVCKGYLAGDKSFRATGYANPISTNHAIVGRDCWMVHQSDIVYADFTGATKVSIGCVMELAWAMLLRKHVVIVMTKENPHYHSFVLEAANIVFESSEQAIDYLQRLALGSQ